MKKPKFTPGETVVITGGTFVMEAVVEQVEALFKEIDNAGNFYSTKDMTGERVLKEFEKLGKAEFKDDIWYIYGKRYKFRDYRYFMRNQGGSLITVKNHRIHNKLQYEAEQVAKRLMRAK